MSNFITKLLKISEQYSFIKPVLAKSGDVSYFKYGPLGELLCQNIYNEWVRSNVIVRDIPVFPFYALNDAINLIDEIKEQFAEAKNICKNTLPFSITFSRIPKIQQIDNNSLSMESKYFKPINTTELKCVNFTSQEEGLQFFHFWQRQRYIWWRMFAANPGRFSLTEIKNDQNMEFCSIQAKFEWGIEPIETIRFSTGKIFENLPEQDRELFGYKVKKKREFPCVIESITNLEIAAICFLCDAFFEEIRLDTVELRQCIKLHRKLTPYKVAFVVDPKGTSERDELKLLAEYLALKVRKAGFPALYVEQLCLSPTKEMFNYYDLLGIPYVVVVKKSTLSEGIFGLRSRETTLEELLHVDQLVQYLGQLYQNY